MATNIYDDAERKTAKRISKLIKQNDDNQGCEFCGNPQCSGHHSVKGKDTDGQLLQTIRGNKELDWRQRFSHPDDFTEEEYLTNMGKTQQLVRDNPTIKGALKSEKAHAIGPNVRLSYTPDFESMGFDIDWMMKSAAMLEDMWERDMEDPVNKWNDASQRQTMSGQFGTAFYDAQSTGEILGLFYPEDKPDDRPMSFSVGLVDVARLSSPYNKTNNDDIRMGQRINKRGRTTTYYISDELPSAGSCGRFTNFARARKAGKMKWTPVRPFTSWGSPQMFHWFDKDRPDQSRGVADLQSALKRAHMHETYEETIIDAAIRDASFALWVQSNSPNVGQAFTTNPGMSPGDFVEEVLGATQHMRTEYYSARNLELKAGQGLITQLMTNEELKSLSVSSPSDNHVNFGRSMQTAMARAIGVDPYSFHGDMTNVNFSTIRAAWIQTWMNRYYKRDAIFTYMGTPIFQVWLEDKIARGEFVIPGIRTTKIRQLNFFYEHRRALTMVEFSGPGMESIDPIKGFKAQEGAINCGLQTRDAYYKQFTNTTFRKATRRLKYEQEYLRSLDLEEFTARGKLTKGSEIGGGASDRVGAAASGQEQNE